MEDRFYLKEGSCGTGDVSTCPVGKSPWPHNVGKGIFTIKLNVAFSIPKKVDLWDISPVELKFMLDRCSSLVG